MRCASIFSTLFVHFTFTPLSSCPFSATVSSVDCGVFPSRSSLAILFKYGVFSLQKNRKCKLFIVLLGKKKNTAKNKTKKKRSLEVQKFRNPTPKEWFQTITLQLFLVSTDQKSKGPIKQEMPVLKKQRCLCHPPFKGTSQVTDTKCRFSHNGMAISTIFICVYIYLVGVLKHFQHCTGHITAGSWKGRGNQSIQFARVLYCKLPTNSKQLPAFPLEAVPGIKPRPQRWEARVLPLCHRGPLQKSTGLLFKCTFILCNL